MFLCSHFYLQNFQTGGLSKFIFDARAIFGSVDIIFQMDQYVK